MGHRRCGSGGAHLFSRKLESNLDFSFCLDWFSILCGWVELPVLHGCDRFITEALARRVFLQNPDIMAIRITALRDNYFK